MVPGVPALSPAVASPVAHDLISTRLGDLICKVEIMPPTSQDQCDNSKK